MLPRGAWAKIYALNGKKIMSSTRKICKEVKIITYSGHLQTISFPHPKYVLWVFFVSPGLRCSTSWPSDLVTGSKHFTLPKSKLGLGDMTIKKCIFTIHIEGMHLLFAWTGRSLEIPQPIDHHTWTNGIAHKLRRFRGRWLKRERMFETTKWTGPGSWDLDVNQISNNQICYLLNLARLNQGGSAM